MNFDQAKHYLARALPWPQDGDPAAFVNIHYTFVPEEGSKDGKLPWAGRACRSLDEAMNALAWAVKSPTTRDIYACLSTQRQAHEKTGKNGYRYFRPIRGQANAVAIKTLFLDIDFKGGAHGYNDQNEACRELARFLKETNLPKPSMLVMSGGGVHVYWTLSRALTISEWQPLAYALAEATKRRGLKCDTQCTVDGARVLRIPGTFNRKTETPRPVTMAGAGTDFDYSVERLWQALEPYKTALPSQPQTTQLAAPSQSVLAKFGAVESLAAGIDKPEFPPIKIDDVARECAFVGDALNTGGKDYPQPWWNLTTLIATFLEDGRTQAHRMGSAHPEYTKESTDDLFDRKEREKAQKGLGWPACATVSGAGCTACQGCKHFAAGKTPLHAALRGSSPNPGALVGANAQPVLAPVAAVAQAQAAQGSQVTPQVTPGDLPKGYSRAADGVVSRVVTLEDGSSELEPVCEYAMEDPWLQRDPGVLHFTSRVERGRKKAVSIPLEIVGTMDMRRHLQAQDFMLPVGNKATENVTRFFLSWIKLLHETRDSVRSSPFGWSYHGSTLEGFVFGGELWTPNGSRQATNGDSELVRQYTPVGDKQPWVDAAKMITDQGREPLQAILASAFGGPLVGFTGEPGVLMSAYSKESGIGKTTAMRIAQAVWGDPVTAMQSLDDTQNSVMNKLGQLRSLPLYWDELKTEEHTRKFVNITFQVTQGKEKSRLTRQIAQREPGRWQTLLVSASNDSLLDYVVKYTSTTTAGLYRVFEFTVPSAAPGSPGQMIPSDAALMVDKLNNHHGVVGLEYARFLGAHHAQIAADMKLLLQQLNAEASSRPDERFWLVCIASTILGARYANHLGFTSIDEVALKRFLIDTLEELRGGLARHPVDMSKEANISNVMAGFFQAMRTKHMLYTNRVHVGRGKPAKGDIVIETTRCDPTRLDGIYVQVGIDNKLIRISRQALCDYLTDKGLSRHVFTQALVDEFKAKHIQGRLGSGVARFVGPTEYLYEIDLTNAPSLDFIDEA